MEKNIGIGIKKTILGVLLISIVVFSITFTYSFFIKNIDQSKGMSTSLKTGNMALTFEDNDNGINKQLSFGETVTKKFKIINTGNVDASLSLDWNMLVNTYLNRSLSYNLKYSTEENGTYEEIVPETNMPTSTTPIKQALASELTVPSGSTYYYNLEITLNDLKDVEQSDDLDAVFNTKFDIGEPSKYRYYRLTIDTNGGSFEEEIQREYLLKNEETVNISNTPTRPGYTFAGWKVQGLSSKFVDGTFTMGISDTYLVAQWNPGMYEFYLAEGCGKRQISRTAFYGKAESLGVPTCEGYTFTGWNVTEGAGTLTGNTTDGYTFTLTEPGNATIEAQWTPNNYKYIVYSNLMNVDGNGYTLYEAGTDEGEAAFNTTVTPEPMNYSGFITPDAQALTIKHETVYPPVLNKIEYNYERDKYTVTIDPNGGEYEGEKNQTSRKFYYGSLYGTLLSTPTRGGYNFNGWGRDNTCTTIYGNDLGNLGFNTSISACWTAKEYSVTFNANGGSTATESKTVTYDTAYGELPTPTYEGYTFEGWYTEANGGTKVTSTTMYTTADNTTLYAHWKKIEFNVPEAVVAIKNNQTPKAVNGTKSSFATVATTDEGVYSMADDYGTSYYYRGAVTNNYVKFGGFYWRIIRINGDGSVRMIYDGTQAYPNANGGEGTGGADRYTHTEQPWNANRNDAKYVGWMYGGENGTTSTSASQAQINETDNNVKSLLKIWYEDNIENNTANSNANLDTYIVDSIFCNDRSMSSTPKEWWTKEASTNRGFSRAPTAYGAFGRFMTTEASWNTTNPSPQFTCPQGNDMFTVSAQIINGKMTNGKNGKKIGLITADEIVAAGAAGAVGEITNKYYYLFKNSSYDYWSLSPKNVLTTPGAIVFEVSDVGRLTSNVVDNVLNGGAVAPVINLSAEASATLTGEGTMTSPYKLPGVE